MCRWHDALESRIAALELRGPPGRADLPRPEEVLESVLDLRPVPAPVLLVPRALVPQRRLDLAGRARTAGPDLGQDRSDDVRLVACDGLHTAP